MGSHDPGCSDLHFVGVELAVLGGPIGVMIKVITSTVVAVTTVVSGTSGPM